MLRSIICSPLTLILSPPRDKTCRRAQVESLGICDKGRGDFYGVKCIGIFHHSYNPLLHRQLSLPICSRLARFLKGIFLWRTVMRK
jgi:hypothetical protein